MPFNEVWNDALDEAEKNGTIDLDDPDTMREFRDAFNDLMRDDEGNERDHFPSAGELSEDERGEWRDFLTEYDLWDEFRDEWEKYEIAA